MSAQLSRANFSHANLGPTSIPKHDNSTSLELISTNLSYADLEEANLSYTTLVSIDLSYANLDKANLIGADLTGAILTNEQLKQAKSLVHAIMPNGSEYR
jgi:serine/threonine protein kinase, bacterial